MAFVYVIDDDMHIRLLAKQSLIDSGLEVETYSGGEELFYALRHRMADCIILDWMMPDMDGLEVIRKLRSDSRFQEIPIILLTAKSEENDKVLGLEVGADDFITKPFGVKEFAARVRAVMRRHSHQEAKEEREVLEIGALRLDKKKRKVKKDGESIDLTTREFDLLALFMANPGQVFSRDALLEKVWKTNYFGDTRTVDVHIRYLRQKLEDDSSVPVYIETLRGVGYRFTDGADIS